MNHCAAHGPSVEACDETEGWTNRLCRRCWEACGEPGIEPHIGSMYAIAAELLRAEEQHQSELRHRENIIRSLQASGDITLCARG